MVDHAKQVLVIVGNQNGMYLISVHNLLNLRNLCFWPDGLGRTGHDVAYSAIEELCLPFLSGTTDITVSDQTDDFPVHLCHTKAQLPFTHKNDGFAEMHLRRQYRQLIATHHILSRCQQTFA